jgi:hypothetical protein
VALFIVTLAGLSGCKGDTGIAGVPGAPATFESAECNVCHHLNNLEINEFDEILVSGLAGTDKSIAGGATTTLSFNPARLPAGETAQSFRWERTGGINSGMTGTNTQNAVVTLPTTTDYKAELIKHVKGMLVSTITGTILSDRAMIVPVNPFNLEEAITAEYKLSVATTSGKNYYGLAKIVDTTGETAAESFAALNTGLPNVAVGLPVLLRAATSSGYTWEVGSAPTGSAPTLVQDGSQLAVFTPSVPGAYVVSQTTGTASSFTLYAGTWRGVITGEDASGRPASDTLCTGCHNGSTAPDKFTPWEDSGHAEIFKQNLNAGGHYSEACFPCHTVGYNTSANNNGFDDQAGFATFVTTSFYFGTSADNSRYRRFLTEYPEMGQRTNVQCENCHGPQEMGDGINSSAHAITTSVTNTARTSMSADVCAVCHGEPQRHARFQQWESSGHGNFELAVEEGTSANCAGCHSAQGFLVWLPRLQAGNPLRSIPSGSITWTSSTVQPQTCALCHDPHAQGTTSGEPNTATTRVEENTPKLPGGFTATGVGRGAICIVCHNSRNGGSGTNSFLHQDGDPVFGRLTSYAAPHASAQGDVLLGYNAYFVGSGNYRSPHSIITDTCATCHMEVTPPPALLSYNLAGTNHTFRASIQICSECHSVNVALGPMYQLKVKASVEALKESIEAKIISRYTGTPLQSVDLIESHGQPAVDAVFAGDGSRAEITLNTLLGIRVADLGTDALAKAIWNLLLIENDKSFGIHNPDFTFAVLGGAQYNVDTIPDSVEPSDEP